MKDVQAKTNPKAAWLASFTRRWHTNPDFCHTSDPVSGHSARVAILMVTIWPDVSREALVVALAHDLGEHKTGDVPAPFKRSNPEFSDVLDQHEADALSGLGFDLEPLTYFEAQLVKLCDGIDAYLWAEHHSPQTVQRDDWREMRHGLIELAGSLNVSHAIEGVLT